MANMLERIALGDIGIKGSFELGIKDEFTGRIVHKIQDKNLFNPVMYAKLRQSIIHLLGLCSVLPVNASPHFSNIDGYKTLTFDFMTLFNTVYLTNSLTSESHINPVMGMDGLVIAAASDQTSASSGTIYGVSSMSEWVMTNSKIYKRWDWTGTNGNGTMSKIFTTPYNKFQASLLHSTEPGFDIFIKNGNTSALPSGTLCGGVSKKRWYVKSASSNSLIMSECGVNSLGLTKTEYSFIVGTSGKTFQVSNFFHVIESIVDPSIIYVVSWATQQTRILINKINKNTGSLVDSMQINLPSIAIYQQGIVTNISGNDIIDVYFACAYEPLGIRVVKIDGMSMVVISNSNSILVTTRTYTSVYNDTYLYLTEKIGDVAYYTTGYSTFAINLVTGEHTSDNTGFLAGDFYNSHAAIYSNNYIYSHSGASLLYLCEYNGEKYYVYRLVPYTSNNLYLRRASGFTPNFVFSTAKLLSYPVTKTNTQAMYVGYTLEFA